VFIATNRLYILNAARIVYFVSQAAIIFSLFTFDGPSLTHIGIADAVSSTALFAL